MIARIPSPINPATDDGGPRIVCFDFGVRIGVFPSFVAEQEKTTDGTQGVALLTQVFANFTQGDLFHARRPVT